MKQWELLLRRTWMLVRDVIFAGFGLWLIYRETTDPGPDALEILGVAVALTVPSAAEHIKALLPSSSGESVITSSSQSSEPRGSPRHATGHGAHGEPAGRTGDGAA